MHTFEVLGWTLIHFCWQASFLVAVYFGLDALCKDLPMQRRYLLTVATIVCMLSVFFGTLIWEALAYVADKALVLRFALGVSCPPLLIDWSTRLLPLLSMTWLAGVLCLTFRFSGGWWQLRRLRYTGLVETPSRVSKLFLNMTSRLGIVRLPVLAISAHISIPMAFGFFRPLVLLPVSILSGLTTDQLEVVIAHEMAHVSRADYFWNLVQTLNETLFFFHPGVWWLGKRLREQRELCCDDTALRVSSDPMIYATALVSLEEQRAMATLAMALDGNESQSDLYARIARILGAVIPPRKLGAIGPLLLLGAFASIFALLSAQPKMHGRARPAELSKLSSVAQVASANNLETRNGGELPTTRATQESSLVKSMEQPHAALHSTLARKMVSPTQKPATSNSRLTVPSPLINEYAPRLNRTPSQHIPPLRSGQADDNNSQPFPLIYEATQYASKPSPHITFPGEGH